MPYIQQITFLCVLFIYIITTWFTILFNKYLQPKIDVDFFQFLIVTNFLITEFSFTLFVGLLNFLFNLFSPFYSYFQFFSSCVERF